MKNRGLDVSSLEEPPVKNFRPQNSLDPFFVVAVNLLCDVSDKRSKAAKIKEASLTTKQFEAFLGIPSHKKYLEDRLAKVFTKSVDISADLALARNVESGDLQSIKYYKELTGKYRPNQEISINLGIVVGRLMEILSSKLEPKLMAEIAYEFEAVLIEAQPKELTA